jgi:carbon-monoxide dehydrogenase medium subunit
MKAPDFRYLKAASVDEAIAALDRHRDEAMVLAGGQSLLSGLNMRLSQPQLVVDINGLSELKGIRVEDNHVRLGALTRHVELQNTPEIAEHLPLLVEAVGNVAHMAIRNRGTLGGSLCNADPAAELPACMVALGAKLVLASPEGQREVLAEEFFFGLFETARAENEILTEVRVPIPGPDIRFAFAEVARRHGDFPMAGLAATVSINDVSITKSRVVYFGCTDRTKPAARTAAFLERLKLPLELSSDLKAAIEADLEASDSPGCRADTKNHLAAVLTCRALNKLKPV